MNCDAARRRLLEEDAPAASNRPLAASADDVRRHLAACPACRVLARRLAQAERQIARLPVPPSSAKAAFVRRFVRTEGPVVRRVPLPWPKPAKERGLQKLSLAVAIAAVLALFTIAWWSWPRIPQPVTPPEPAWIVQLHHDRDAALALPTADARVAGLTAVAKGLRVQVEGLSLPAQADDLTRLAEEYEQIVRRHLPQQAQGLAVAERPGLLAGAADELRTAESTFSRMKAEKPGVAEQLEQLAAAARDGGRDIRALRDAT